jgi:hypothetical protein
MFRQKNAHLVPIFGVLRFEEYYDDGFHGKNGLRSLFRTYVAIFDAQNPFDRNDPIHYAVWDFRTSLRHQLKPVQEASIKLIVYEGGIYHHFPVTHRSGERLLYGCTKKSRKFIVPSQEGISLDGLL